MSICHKNRSKSVKYSGLFVKQKDKIQNAPHIK